jgi:hypothetical protein
MSTRIFRGVLGGIALVPLLWIGSCRHFEASHARGFEALRIGDTEARVVALMGEPTKVESRGEGFPPFADEACRDPCARRLWYATRLNLDTEAWSIEIGEAGRVVHTAHWVSP